MMSDGSRSAGGWRRRTLLVLLAIAGFLVLRAIRMAMVNRVPLEFIHGATFQVATLGLCLGLVLLVMAARGEWGASESPAGVAPLRWFLVTAVITWILYLALVQPFQRIWFDLALGLGAGAWGGVVLGLRRAPSRAGRALHWLELVTFSLCAAALGLELGLRGFVALRPTPLLARVGAGPGELVQRFRCAPGEVRFGFPCNSGGFYDEEFYRKSGGSDSELIVSVGDSFSVGAVPHAWHYTSVIEELTGASIYSMGVAGIGPAEYAHLIATEAVPLAPDELWISVFVGNDLNVVDVLGNLPDSGLRSWFQRDQVLLLVLTERLARIRGERARLEARGGDVVSIQGRGARSSAKTRAEAAADFPWVLDPNLEEGTLSEETFLELEVNRALDVCAQDPPSMQLFRRSMLAAREAAGSITLRVILIPDEFQVEDELWAQVRERVKMPLERDRPQRLLRAWLERAGFEVLDLLPALREAPALEDGRRHLYHSFDTHFNSRGNEVAARAIVQAWR
jgi:hypothetical protein